MADTGKAPRKKRQSDDVYNARRRFRRQAQRYLAKADNSGGLERARYEALARNATMNAIRTYGSGQKVQGQVKELADRLDITERSFELRAFARGFNQSGVNAKQVSDLVQKSFSALSGKGRSRDDMARDILSAGNIGSRFYGGLVQIWGVDEESRKHPNKAILDYFTGANDMLDVLEELEDAGIDLYAPDVNDDVYKSVQLKLQRFILQRKRISKNG